MTKISVTIADQGEQAKASLARLVSERFASRLFAADATLWGPGAVAEATIRLGWTDFADDAQALIAPLTELRGEFAAIGVDRFVLCGMGGSSLAPAVITSSAGVGLTMLDTTHPEAVRRTIGSEAELARTAVIVSSKSGGTIETLSHLAAFEAAFEQVGIAASSRIVIVTDPDSALEASSREAGRRIFLANPNIGGRFSALAAFGLVPSGLAGVDLSAFVQDAADVRELLASDSPDNPALRIAAALFAALPQRYVLATSATGNNIGFGSWIEQLIAESTGKDGVGVLPIALPPHSAAAVEGFENVLSVRCNEPRLGEDGGSELFAADAGVNVTGRLGAQFLCWEVVTAALGALMSIDPFNQPDVESAKVAARTALSAADDAQGDEAVTSVEVPPASEVISWLRDHLSSDGYLAVQAFLDPGAPYATKLAVLRDRLAQRLGVPVALCLGPSYLHSTGQLHKGGPKRGAFLQLIDVGATELEIPGGQHGFGQLLRAQARGDREVLTGHGRPVYSISVAEPGELLDDLCAVLDDSGAAV